MAKVSKYGQWKYPGEDTIIPNANGNITMKGVPYPVLGIDDLGNQQMMMPGMDYQFPGNSVYEIPMMAYGGDISIPSLKRVKIKSLPKAQTDIEYPGVAKDSIPKPGEGYTLPTVYVHGDPAKNETIKNIATSPDTSGAFYKFVDNPKYPVRVVTYPYGYPEMPAGHIEAAIWDKEYNSPINLYYGAKTRINRWPKGNKKVESEYLDSAGIRTTDIQLNPYKLATFLKYANTPQNYNFVSNNCADGVCRGLGIDPENVETFNITDPAELTNYIQDSGKFNIIDSTGNRISVPEGIGTILNNNIYQPYVKPVIDEGKRQIDDAYNWGKKQVDDTWNYFFKKQGGSKGDPPNQGLSSMGAENRLYTYKDDATWFDSRARYSDNSRYSDQIRHAVYSGNYGYNPVTGVLEKLPTNKRTNVSTETQRRLAEGENKQAYQKSIVDAGFNPETFAKPTAEEEKALEDRRIKDYVIKGHELAINNPVFKAGAYLTPAGMAVGAVEGAAHFLPDVYNFAENPSWGGAANVGMDALLAAPIARQLFSNARVPLNPPPSEIVIPFDLNTILQDARRVSLQPQNMFRDVRRRIGQLIYGRPLSQSRLPKRDALPINKSLFTKDEAKLLVKDKVELEKLEKLNDRQFEQILLSPDGKIKLPETYKGPKQIAPIEKKEWVADFNDNIDLLNKIIRDNNKSGRDFWVTGIDEDGKLMFKTADGHTSTMYTNITPGRFRGEVQDIADQNYMINEIPGLQISSASPIFGFGDVPRGTRVYESLNDYLKKLDLGRIKSGMNIQSEFSRPLWENAIQNGKAYGYYKTPRTVYGIMKQEGGSIPKAQLLGNLTPEQKKEYENRYVIYREQGSDPNEANKLAQVDASYFGTGPIYNFNPFLPDPNSGVQVTSGKRFPYEHIDPNTFNSWQDNYMSDRDFLKRYNSMTPDQQELAKRMVEDNENLDNYYTNLEGIKRWEKNWYSQRAKLPQFTDVANKRLSLVESVNMQPWGNNQEYVDFSPGSVGMYEPNENTINIPALSFGATGTMAHERSHWYDFNAPQYTDYGVDYNDNDPLLNNILPVEYSAFQFNDPLRRPNTSGKEYDTESEKILGADQELEPTDSYHDLRSIQVPYKTFDEHLYMYKPTEVRARLNEWRLRHNIDPTKNYTNEEIQQIIDKDIQRGNIDNNDLYKVIRGRGDLLKQIHDAYVSTGNKESSDDLPKAQDFGTVEEGLYKIAAYEKARGSRTSGGVPKYGNPRLKDNPTDKDAVDWMVANMLPIAKNYYTTPTEQVEAIDFIYNTGRDPRIYQLDQYLRSIGQPGLPNRGSYNIDYYGANPNSNAKAKLAELDKLWQQHGPAINKLSVNQRRQLLNKGRDFYYQNIEVKSDGSPSDAYYNTWYGRIWNTNDARPFDPKDPRFVPKRQEGGQQKDELSLLTNRNRAFQDIIVDDEVFEQGDFDLYLGQAQEGLPSDYDKFLAYSETAPENRRPDANWQYGDPRQYDHYGMWDALGKPENFNQALEMNPHWQPDPYDGMYHGFSTNPNTGVWLKSHIPGESEPGSTAWMENLAFALSNDPNWGPKNQNLVYDPELQRMRYINREQRGGLQKAQDLGTFYDMFKFTDWDDDEEYDWGIFSDLKNMMYPPKQTLEQPKKMVDAVYKPSDEYVKELMFQENGVNKGLKNGRYYPYDSVEGGTPTIGYGHKLTEDEVKSKKYANGLSYDEVVNLMYSDLDKHAKVAKSSFESEFGKGSFDNLNTTLKDIVLDFSYTGTGINKFPNFHKAVYQYSIGDPTQKSLAYAKMLDNYKRNTNGKPLVSRNAYTEKVLKTLK